MQKKIKFTFFILFSLYSLVLLKAFWIQVIAKDKLLTYARSQYQRVTKEYPPRGNIYDRSGQPLSINIQSFSISTFPKIKNQDYLRELRELSRIVPSLTYSSLISKVRKRSKFTWIARKIRLDKRQVEALKKMEFIHTQSHFDRVYPNKELSSQVLGYVGIDQNGLSGVELSQNSHLKGEPRIVRYVRDAKGRPVKFEAEDAELKSAKEIFLSLDKELQAYLEESLRESYFHHEAEKVGATVMDAQTGEILAMANYPSFDPNKPGSFSAESQKNGIISDAFEPGSIFKTFTIASALEHQITSIQKKYYCEKGAFRLNGHTIGEAESDKKYEWLTVNDILKYSSNIGTTKIAFNLGSKRLFKTLVDLELDQKSQIQLSGESKGIFPSQTKVSDLQLSNISFGHGIATTPLQVLRAYGAIANGGFLLKPSIIRVDDPSRVERKQVFSKATTEALTSMLKAAVEEGTGKNAIIPQYVIAGKTGTAQKVSPTGGYSGYISSFVGYPVNVSRPFVVLVYVDNPKKNGYYGNLTAAPVFKKITQYLLYRRKDFTSIAETQKAKPNIHEYLKNEVRVFDDKVNSSVSATRVYGEGLAPNLLGLDKQNLLKLSESLGLKIETQGFGISKSQSPSAGEALAPGQIVKVQFAVPTYEE
jgi:cell division protein FtsI (penicillin-binding protein 3)